MARLVTRVRDSGWCLDDLAAYMNVSRSTIGSWARGASMGTNGDRAMLSGIRPPEEERPYILLLVAQLENEVQRREKLSVKAAESGAHYLAADYKRGLSVIRSRIETLKGIAK